MYSGCLRETPGVFLVLSMVAITHELWSRHKSFSSCWKLNSGVALTRPSTPLSIGGDSPTYLHNPAFSPLLVTTQSISALASSRGALRRGTVESRAHLQPFFFMLPGKEATEEANSSSGLAASIKHKTRRSNNK